MASSRAWWLIFLLAAGCAAVEPAPVEERRPTAKPAPAVKTPADSAKAAPKVKDERPDFYVVKRGDTLYSIGLEFGYDYREIAKANNIQPPFALRVGQRLDFKSLKQDGTGTPVTTAAAPAAEEGGVVITPLNTPVPLNAPPPVQATPLPAPAPVISQPKAVREPYSLQALNTPPPVSTKQPMPATGVPAPGTNTTITESPKPAEPAKPAETPAATPAAATASDSAWAWPTQGKVIKGFSESGSARGIDIAGTMGQPIHAAGPGKVIYSGQDLRGYGKLVIIKHDDNFLSVYAHNSNILVKEGQQVVKGQKIAEMGNTDSDQVKLHFEIRQQGKSVDPMKYLSGNPG
jgi:lipoprotein NlpD